MKFEHFTFTEKEVKELGLKILKLKSIFKLLEDIHKKNIKKYHYDYCPNAVWRDMQERCIIFKNDKEALVLEKKFNKMIKIYKEGDSDHMSFYYKVEEFNPIMAMFMRNQISEC